MACFTGAPAPVAPTIAAVPLPVPRAAEAIAQVFSNWALSNVTVDTLAGLVTAEPYELKLEKKLAGHKANHWADCGKQFGMSEAATADWVTFRLSASLSAHERPDSSRVTVQADMRAYESGAAFDCASRGRLEQALLDELRRLPPAP